MGEEGLFVLGESVMGAGHVPWGNTGNSGKRVHAQEDT